MGLPAPQSTVFPGLELPHLIPQLQSEGLSHRTMGFFGSLGKWRDRSEETPSF